LALPKINFQHFYTYRQLTAALRGLVKECPQLARLEPVGRSPEGREVWLLEVTNRETGPAEEKPAYLVHANIHATELAGTTAALWLGRHLLAGYGEDELVTDLLDHQAFYLIPRLNPDGAEQAVTMNAAVRSRTELQDLKNGHYQADVNGDGLILDMRWEDPDGDLKPDLEEPRLLIPRRAEDRQGPFYRRWPEGFIRDWDGFHIRGASRSFDFNRNFPAFWQPEHLQGGAGDFPFSEPEMRALGEFAYAHPNVFGMLGFHTGGNSVLRPSATRGDDELNAADVKIMRELGEKGAALTGFKLRSVMEYCRSYSVTSKLQGHFTDWGYDHLGLFVFEIELGNLYNTAGIATDEWQEASPEQREAFDRRALAWHDEHPEYGAFRDWQPFDHPQLGRVEIGGWKRDALYNPWLKDLQDIAPKCTRFILEHARRAPRLTVRTTLERIEGAVYRLRAEVVNGGQFPTHVTAQATKLASTKPVSVKLEGGAGLELLSRSDYAEIGQLAGPGGKQEVEWFLRRTGEPTTATVVARAPKGGVARAEVRF
jgi:murein tripeptide amidase MpaA